MYNICSALEPEVVIEEGKRKTSSYYLEEPHVCNSKSQIYRLLHVLLPAFAWELCGADSMQLDMKEHAMIDTSVRTIYTDNIRED